jgi:hypothetical protein
MKKLPKIFVKKTKFLGFLTTGMTLRKNKALGETRWIFIQTSSNERTGDEKNKKKEAANYTR